MVHCLVLSKQHVDEEKHTHTRGDDSEAQEWITQLFAPTVNLLLSRLSLASKAATSCVKIETDRRATKFTKQTLEIWLSKQRTRSRGALVKAHEKESCSPLPLILSSTEPNRIESHIFNIYTSRLNHLCAETKDAGRTALIQLALRIIAQSRTQWNVCDARHREKPTNRHQDVSPVSLVCFALLQRQTSVSCGNRGEAFMVGQLATLNLRVDSNWQHHKLLSQTS